MHFCHPCSRFCDHGKILLKGEKHGAESCQCFSEGAALQIYIKSVNDHNTWHLSVKDPVNCIRNGPLFNPIQYLYLIVFTPPLLLSSISLLHFVDNLTSNIRTTNPSVRSNALFVLGDMCVRYTNLVDRHIGVLAGCLQVKSTIQES